MENENVTPTPITEETPLQMPLPTIEPTKNKSSGALIGTIIALVILVLGGLYLWSARVQPQIEQKALPPSEQTAAADENAAVNIAVEQLGTQSNSDETASIEADLAATDLNNMDKDLQAI
jgi:hypothetical protein